jgi:uncharacterized membrane protein
MALGTLIGALAGPVGLLVGMISGTMTGALLETNYYHFSDDFISKVYSHLQPGAVAVVAEIYEQGPVFVDNAMEALGGTIIRSNVDDAYDQFLNDQVKGIEAGIMLADRIGDFRHVPSFFLGLQTQSEFDVSITVLKS